MPIADPFQAEVARLALAAARRYGFALAGGQALCVHGIVDRPTEDIDLFTDADGGVRAAATLVEAALRKAGLMVEEIPDTSGLGEVFDGFDRDMAEYEISRGDQAVRLQLVRFDRGRAPILMDIGPVLHVEDLLGSKTAAMVTRAEPRDFIDVAAALDRYTRSQLVDLAVRADPAITDEELADAMRRLDHLHDTVFTELYGLTPQQVGHLRHHFADWPRP